MSQVKTCRLIKHIDSATITCGPIYLFMIVSDVSMTALLASFATKIAANYGTAYLIM